MKKNSLRIIRQFIIIPTCKYTDFHKISEQKKKKVLIFTVNYNDTSMRLITFLAAAGLCLLNTVSAEADSRSRINLSGEWKTGLGTCVLPGTTDENRLGQKQTDTSETGRLSRIYPFSGKLEYEKDITVPENFAEGKRLRLVMERTKPTTLRIDGKSIGKRNSLLTPHVYDLPHLAAGKHHFSIEVDNSGTAVPQGIQPSHAWSESTQTNWNGILGDFYIEALDSTYISSIKVCPDLAGHCAIAEVTVIAHRETTARITAEAVPARDGTESRHLSKMKVRLSKGSNTVRLKMDMEENPLLWSEFHPDIYNISVSLTAGKCSDTMTESFGMREFSVSGTQFAINGYRTFLRGKHDACVFPLTGYATMSVEEWREVFRKARQYGINHYRFHSWTPPEAAFTAADLEGIYLQTELPLWCAIDRENEELNSYILEEAARILDEYGNHPSFVMLGLGNELHGDDSLMKEWIDDFREKDSRHLYCFGSNNNLGFNGPQQGEDFFVTCRVGGGEGYSTHTRTSFAFADAEKGGILNNTRPGTRGNYSYAISKSDIPVIGHETCQFQSYPDFSQIEKYTGVLYPWNLVNFRHRLENAGLGGMDRAFSKASGTFAVECMKADIEYALRTPGFGGFQMLDLQDYPGQGTALVGVLDAFMEEKNFASAEYFHGFCSPLVPLASFDSYCIKASDTLEIDLLVANYLEQDWNSLLKWEISVSGSAAVSGTANTGTPQGTVSRAGRISFPVSSLLTDPDKAAVLDLTLSTGEWSNSYRLWVYPDGPAEDPGEILVTGNLDDSLLEKLEQGSDILLIPEYGTISDRSVGGLFTPDFWNWSMFKRISERGGKEISPGTLSIYTDPAHKALEGFPNDGYSDMQWWSIALNSRPLIIDSLPTDYRPVVSVIDNPERCHRLAILMEFKVGKGRLMICTTDLKAISGTPEGRAYAGSILRYMKSDKFCPPEATRQQIESLFRSTVETKDIQGVENPTDYDI